LTDVVFVTGEGVAEVEVLVANVELVPYWNPGTVDVVPTVRLPFIVAVVDVTWVAAIVVTVTAVFQVEMFAALNVPPSAASSAASSLAA
jgi:hypothetical protein